MVIGKTMLMHRKLHRLVAEASEELRHSVGKGQVCASCDDLVVSAIVSAVGRRPYTYESS